MNTPILARCLFAFGTGLAAMRFCAGEVRHVELGAGLLDAGASALALPDAAVRSGYGCADWIDTELNALREGSCEGFCDASPAQPYDLESKLSVMAGTAGRWAYCGQGIGPDDVVGMEFAPGCRIFFLRYDDAGIAVRGTEAVYQADFDVFDPRPAGAPARIDLHFSPTHTVTMEIEAFRCPEGVVLKSEEQTLNLARFDGHGGTGVPVR